MRDREREAADSWRAATTMAAAMKTGEFDQQWRSIVAAAVRGEGVAHGGRSCGCCSEGRSAMAATRRQRPRWLAVQAIDDGGRAAARSSRRSRAGRGDGGKADGGRRRAEQRRW